MDVMDTSRKPRKRVVIVDDSKTMQATLEQIFSLRMGLDVVGIASDIQSAVPMIHSLLPDLVTIDLCMPYIDGSTLLETIADLPDVRKVVISAQAGTNLAILAKLEQAGADACIDRAEMSRNPASFCGKIKAILARPLDPSVPARADLRVVGSSGSGHATTYPIPFDEKARLQALHLSSLANDDLDHQLDLLTAHLGATTDFPTSAITFIDRDTQWIKSAYGLARGSVPRALAFCAYTLCGDEPFVVTNAATDKRFAANPFVTGEPGIRTYVGCPITSEAGVRLGAVCLIDSKPRRVTPSTLTNLRGISKIASEMVRMRIARSLKAA